jgi:hypothetical protein
VAQEQVIIEFIGDTEKLKTAFNEIIQLQTKSAGISDQQTADFVQANQDMAKALGQTTAALNATAAQVKALSDSFRDLGKSILALNLADAAQALKQVSDKATELTDKYKKLSIELAAAKKALDDMAKAGKENTDAYKEQSAAVEKLTKDTQDLSKQMVNLGSQSKTISGIIGIGKIAAKGFEEASAASKLFGGNAEMVEKALTKLNEAIKVLNGLQEIEKALTEQGAAAKLIENGQRIAGAAATGLQSAAESEYTVVRWAAVAAQTALNAVMEANPVLLLIGAVAALSVGMLALSGNTKEAAAAHKKLNEELEKSAYDAALEDIEFRRATKQISDSKAERLRIETDYAEKVKNLDRKVLEEAKLSQAELIYKDHVPEFDNSPLAQKAHAAFDARKKEYIDLSQEFTDQIKIIDRNDSQKQLEEEIAGLKLKQSKVGQATQEYYNYLKQIVAKENQLISLDLVKGVNDNQIALAIEENKKKLTDYAKWLKDLKAENASEVALAGQKSQDKAVADNKKIIDDQIADLERLRLQAKKYGPEDLAMYSAQIRLKKQLVENTPGLSKQQQELQNAQLDKQEEEYYQQSLDNYQQFLANKRAATDKEAQTELTNTTTTNKAILDSQKSTAGEKKAAQIAIDEANVVYKQKELEAEQNYYDKFKKALIAANKDTEQLEREHKANMAAINAGKQTAQTQLTNDTSGSTTSDNSQQPLYHLDTNTQQGLQAAQSFAKQTADAVFQIENQARDAKFNAEISNLQKISEFELNNRNLTEAQKAAIQKKYDRQQAAIKLQQWKADQKSKEEQATINGFLAVTNALATTPFPASIITAALALATSTAEVAAIAAQKPPQFAKGTPAGAPDTPAGLKLVGEEGPELIYTPGGDRIITAPDTAALLAKYAIPQIPAVGEYMDHQAAQQAILNIDYAKLGKSVAEALKSNPQSVVNMDKSGFASYLVQRGNKFHVVNNKFQA